MEARILLEYENTKDAKVIADAVSPDNFKTPPELTIETKSKEDKVITLIRCTEKIQTFIATIDDLLFCATTAEKVIRTAKKLDGISLSESSHNIE